MCGRPQRWHLHSARSKRTWLRPLQCNEGGYIMSNDMVLTPGGLRPKGFVNAIEPGHE